MHSRIVLDISAEKLKSTYVVVGSSAVRVDRVDDAISIEDGKCLLRFIYLEQKVFLNCLCNLYLIWGVLCLKIKRFL